MDKENSITLLESSLGYHFKSPSLLEQALSAAGANEDNHDGNRKLAQLGESMLIAFLNDCAYDKGGSRSK